MRKIMLITAIGAVVVVAVVDGIALMSGSDQTLSDIVFTSSRHTPLIPFLAGLVCGHFFWPMYSSTEK